MNSIEDENESILNIPETFKEYSLLQKTKKLDISRSKTRPYFVLLCSQLSDVKIAYKVTWR